MENNNFVKYMGKRFNVYFDDLEDIIERCPDEIWNKKCSGYTFWHQLVHTICTNYLWLRDEKVNFFDAIDKGINGLSIYNELDAKPEEVTKELYTKSDLLKMCTVTKYQCETWFKDKNNEWLSETFKMSDKYTNLDVTIMMMEHTMYHIGHFEAIFRENNIKTKKYLDG